MIRFISLGGPVGGFFCGVKSKCNILRLPDFINEIVSELVYTDFIQDLIAATGYWRDPYNVSGYLIGARSMPFLDNEVEFNPIYK